MRKHTFYFVFQRFPCHYTNGVLEGLNTKIKTIKPIPFGYKSSFILETEFSLHRSCLN
ncbi:transposase [Acetobacterium tundrae]|uniref:transposase n=1 Tax=Acetobacterium tundrae TaxID=132932 RepID=UPI00164BC875|nr:transposase [Acetobacterium tundrae]